MSNIRILNVNDTTDLNLCSLGTPGRVQGGSYYSKLFYNKEPLYFRVNETSTKQGIIETGKKKYVDLMFSVYESEYTEWFQSLEDRCKTLLVEKTDDWFSNIEKDDIEHFFISCMRQYKTNKTLVRSHLYVGEQINRKCIVFDENKVQTSYSNVKDKKISCILHLKGVRFTTSSFQLDIDVKQILIQEDTNVFNECLFSDNTIANTKIPLEIIDDKNNVDDETDKNEVNIESKDVQQEAEPTQETTQDTVSDDAPDNDETVLGIDNKENQLDTSVEAQCNESGNLNDMDTQKSEELKGDTDNIEEINEGSCIEEVELDFNTIKDDKNNVINLIKPDTIYKEMYKKAKRKLRETRKQAIKAYLEADQMKSNYNIVSSDDSSTDDEDELNKEMFLEKVVKEYD